jgi:hypothetical protein
MFSTSRWRGRQNLTPRSDNHKPQHAARKTAPYELKQKVLKFTFDDIIAAHCSRSAALVLAAACSQANPRRQCGVPPMGIIVTADCASGIAQVRGQGAGRPRWAIKDRPTLLGGVRDVARECPAAGHCSHEFVNDWYLSARPLWEYVLYPALNCA